MNKEQHFMLILHFLNDNGKRLIVGHRQKDICANKMVNKQFEMALNEINSLRKTFNNKIMTFPSALDTLARYCVK